MDDIVLTTGACHILNCAPATVHVLERRGVLPAMRTDRGVRVFRREDCERVAAERRAAADRKKAE